MVASSTTGLLETGLLQCSSMFYVMVLGNVCSPNDIRPFILILKGLL